MTRGIEWPDPVRMRTRNAETAYSWKRCLFRGTLVESLVKIINGMLFSSHARPLASIVKPIKMPVSPANARGMWEGWGPCDPMKELTSIEPFERDRECTTALTYVYVMLISGVNSFLDLEGSSIRSKKFSIRTEKKFRFSGKISHFPGKNLWHFWRSFLSFFSPQLKKCKKTL